MVRLELHDMGLDRLVSIVQRKTLSDAFCAMVNGLGVPSDDRGELEAAFAEVLNQVASGARCGSVTQPFEDMSGEALLLRFELLAV
jgi:hypothetical protein